MLDMRWASLFLRVNVQRMQWVDFLNKLKVPQQFFSNTSHSMIGCVKPDAIAISTVKGVELADDPGILTLSTVISRILHVQVAALMGANLALDPFA
uniref:NAD_Gly3P_dh_N domain-containing protein n=1 Tax=Trichuris muris TaxID=70415 RepID=A0A5S6QGP0_TRIMR